MSTTPSRVRSRRGGRKRPTGPLMRSGWRSRNDLEGPGSFWSLTGAGLLFALGGAIAVFGARVLVIANRAGAFRSTGAGVFLVVIGVAALIFAVTLYRAGARARRARRTRFRDEVFE